MGDTCSLHHRPGTQPGATRHHAVHAMAMRICPLQGAAFPPVSTRRRERFEVCEVMSAGHGQPSVRSSNPPQMPLAR